VPEHSFLNLRDSAKVDLFFKLQKFKKLNVYKYPY